MLMNFTATQYYEWEKAAVIAMVIMLVAVISAVVITLVTQPFATKTRSVITTIQWRDSQ